jgi:hypothetical protein
MERSLTFVMPCISVTCKDMLEMPADVGIPEIVPVVPFNTNPVGNVPAASDHV